MTVRETSAQRGPNPRRDDGSILTRNCLVAAFQVDLGVTTVQTNGFQFRFTASLTVGIDTGVISALGASMPGLKSPLHRLARWMFS